MPFRFAGVEQNLGVADALADRVYVMLTGQIAHEASGAEFAVDVHARRKYLAV